MDKKQPEILGNRGGARTQGPLLNSARLEFLVPRSVGRPSLSWGTVAGWKYACGHHNCAPWPPHYGPPVSPGHEFCLLCPFLLSWAPSFRIHSLEKSALCLRKAHACLWCLRSTDWESGTPGPGAQWSGLWVEAASILRRPRTEELLRGWHCSLLSSPAHLLMAIRINHQGLPWPSSG